jgi:hypothetical protein
MKKLTRRIKDEAKFQLAWSVTPARRTEGADSLKFDGMIGTLINRHKPKFRTPFKQPKSFR